jgi:hypothetical protein
LDQASATIDPAIVAVAEFRQVEQGFEAWLRQDLDGFIGADEIELEETDWQDDYEAKLARAAQIVPTTMLGVRALSEVFEYQERMGASRALLGAAARSSLRGLATMPESEWSAI